MKEVYLIHRDKDDWYDITDKEFQEMIEAWEHKKGYWCSRLEVFFKESAICEIRTPLEEVGKKVLIDTTVEEKFDVRYYEVDGNYYKINDSVKEDNSHFFSEEKKKKLMPIEDYYNGQQTDTAKMDNEALKQLENKLK